MTSLQTSMKQSQGYFVVSGTTVKAYTYAGGSGAGGSFLPGVMTQADVTVIAGTVLRDMGKTVLTGNLGQSASATSAAGAAGQAQRVFRKVQWLNKLSSVGSAANVANGVSSGAANTSEYNTFYIELPTAGRSGGATNDVFSVYTYVPGLSGL